LLHPSPCNERFVAMDAAVLHCVCGVHAVTVTHAADAVRYECEHLQSAPTRCIHLMECHPSTAQISSLPRQRLRLCLHARIIRDKLSKPDRSSEIKRAVESIFPVRPVSAAHTFNIFLCSLLYSNNATIIVERTLKPLGCTQNALCPW
jgi:hypothetical protein